MLLGLLMKTIPKSEIALRLCAAAYRLNDFERSIVNGHLSFFMTADVFLNALFGLVTPCYYCSMDDSISKRAEFYNIELCFEFMKKIHSSY